MVGWELKNICVEIAAVEALDVGHVLGVADVKLRGKSEHRQLELHDGHAIPHSGCSELANPGDLVVTTLWLSLECLGHGSVHPKPDEIELVLVQAELGSKGLPGGIKKTFSVNERGIGKNIWCSISQLD